MLIPARDDGQLSAGVHGPLRYQHRQTRPMWVQQKLQLKNTFLMRRPEVTSMGSLCSSANAHPHYQPALPQSRTAAPFDQISSDCGEDNTNWCFLHALNSAVSGSRPAMVNTAQTLGVGRDASPTRCVKQISLVTSGRCSPVQCVAQEALRPECLLNSPNTCALAVYGDGNIDIARAHGMGGGEKFTRR